MRILQTFGFLFLLALALPLPRAAAVPLDATNGYIAGQVLFPGFTTTSISTTAVGGGNTFQQTTYNDSQYQLEVPGTETSYLVSSSCGLGGGNNTSLTVSFNQRDLTVASGETTANEYVFNPGVVRFEVTLTGDPSLSTYSSGSWATRTVATGEKTASYSAGTPTTTAREFSWEIPVVPNPQIELTAKVVVNSPVGARTYVFGKTAPSPYTLAPIDVAPGELVIVPLEIHLTGESAPAAVTHKGALAGGVNLLGLSSSHFLRHTFNGRTLFANPDTYTRDYSFTGNQFTTTIGPPNTYFEADIDGSLRWPYTNGDALNNRVTVYPDTTSYFDQERMGGYLRGEINLSGTVKNEDLTSITLNLSGFGRVYQPVTKKWTTLENYYGAATIRRDAAAYGVRRPHERDYQLFLTTGPWELGSITLSRWFPSPSRTSSVTFTDHAIRYDGRTYFGTPVLIAPGDNEKNFDYCFGSARFRFWDPQGRLLKNPFVTGTGSHRTNGALALEIAGISANSTETQVATAEVEVFGPPGEYRFSTVRIQTEDGATLTYPARNVTLSCGTTKEFDFPGPTLSVTSPEEGLITNAAVLPVSGQVFGNSPTTSVTIDGIAAALTPVAGGSANEIAFEAALSFPEGANIITVTATDTLGARTIEHLPLFVDRQQPTVSIAGLPDGGRFISTDSIPLQVEAADRGYGYTFFVLLDGSVIHSASGKANPDTAEVLTFDTVLRFLPVGTHLVTANVVDLAGNVSDRSLTLVIEEPPPVLSGLIDQTLEASSAMGASATFDITATSSCNLDPLQSALPAPTPAPQSHALTSGASLSKTFHWGAVTGLDEDPVEYRIEVSDTLDFAAIRYQSAWQTATTWDQSLPPGIWYWRVSARDSVHTSLQSSPATGNSFIIVQTGNTQTEKFSISHFSVCNLDGGVVTDYGIELWVGTYDGIGVDRSFLMFDTSRLGPGASVTSATLKLDYEFDEYLALDSVTTVHESDWELPGAYSGPIGNLLASQPISVGRPFGLIPFDIRPDYINKTGITKFALKAAEEDFSALPNSDPGFYRPASHLEVTYTVTNDSIWPGPQLLPQGNTTTNDDTPIDLSFQWAEMTASDGDPVHYQVEFSSTADFSTLLAGSPWLSEPVWSHRLPAGTWYWRVTARDAVHTDLVSLPAASSFIITYLPSPAETGVTCSAASGDVFPLGVTPVTCQAVDACNRIAEGSFTITVQDTTEPLLILPPDLTVEAVTAAGAPVFFEASATDAIDPAPAVACSPASGSTFPLGDSLVTCTATDVGGNLVLGLFQVTVTEMKWAELSAPGDLVVEATALRTVIDIGQATVVHSLPVILSNDAPETFPVGTTVVTWTATDSNGAAVTASQNITVVDTTSPLVIPPESLTIEATGMLTPVSIDGPNVTDAVGVVSLTSDAPATFPLGPTSVSWTATDAAGNQATAVQTVTVVDRTPPTLGGLIDQVLEATAPSGTVASFTVTASDLVDLSPGISCSAASGSTFPLGDSLVTCTAIDLYDNSISASFLIQVRDTTPPVLTVPADITVLLNTPLGASTIQDFLTGAAAEDAVDAAVDVHSSIPGELNTVGDKEVTFTAADNAGNRSTATALIRVVYGGGDEFFSPVGLRKPFKLGSTIPVKIGFFDAAGTAVTQAAVQLFLYPVSDDVPAEEPLAIESTSSADAGNYFRVVDGMYIYNLSTKNLTSGTYQIRAALDDGTYRTVPLALKR